MRVLKYPALILFTLILLAPVSAMCQCILANPSFEISGSNGQVFEGWNQFGDTGYATEASHGFNAARVSGQNNGIWSVSGYWQNFDCAPGEQWNITGNVMHPSTNPLTGQCVAIVNVEWRNAVGDLIDYDTFNVCFPTSQVDQYIDFQLTSDQAPAGTASTHFLLGVLQSPSDISPDVYFDQVTFFSTTTPTIDEVQWNDFPGGRTIAFGGYNWRVKGPGYFGPGNNYFSDSETSIWIDQQDRLHLTLKNAGSTWLCSEVVNEDALGYGDYILTTSGQIHLLDPAAVLGVFLWEYGPCWDDSYTWWNAYNEVDIEFSRWGNAQNGICQFVVQPWDFPGNIIRFDTTFGEDELVSSAMRWSPDKIEFRIWRGDANQESQSNLIQSWTYTGPHIARPEQPRIHLNLWKLSSNPVDIQEVIFDDFVFVPLENTTSIDETPGNHIACPNGRLHSAYPNPFNPKTSLKLSLINPDYINLDIFDIDGAIVKNITSGYFDSGEHHFEWDGLDNNGRKVASGLFICRLKGNGYIETQRLILIK
ncbi:MAG: T9SS type A sorting domain-containing protein [bacterium]|nr:T9SS type A sorting domain-containing protein [bacterium]MCP4799126.1 T9SS type A sorting domain-containing protein [bacterium]